jgi:4-hydroxybenzoate polyprenyltransferase
MPVKNRTIRAMTGFIDHYFGWRNWSVLVYNSVLENLFVLFYIALRKEMDVFRFSIDFIIFLFYSMFCTTYGYLVNDLGDKELDKRQGKANTFADDSVLKASMVVLLFLLLSIAAGLWFVKNYLFLPVWICWVFFSTAYSLKPVRLKERGKTGLLFVVLAQRVLPTLLIFFAFRHYQWLDVIVITAYIFFRGLSSDINHQLEDYREDAATGTETFAVKTGNRKTRMIFRVSLEMEKLLLLGCLVVMYLELPGLKIIGIPPMLAALIFYIIIYAASLVKIISQKGAIDVNPFVQGRKDIFQFMHHTFPSDLLPLGMMFLLVYMEWRFVFLFLGFIIFRRMYSLELIRNSFPVRLVQKLMGR